MVQVGITEGGDAALDLRWQPWVEKGLPAILITKNARKLYDINPELFVDENNKYKNVIIHVTVTGLGGTVFEPNVPDYKEILDFLDGVSIFKGFHKERIVVRCDPIIPAFAVKDELYKASILNIAWFARKHRFRYRTSFFDYYPHVKTIFAEIAEAYPETKERIDYLNSIQPEFHMSLELRQMFLDIIKGSSGLYDDEIEICGEPGMKCSGCLSKRDLDTFGVTLDDDPELEGIQRPACACLGLKKELIPNKHPCGHKCAYCFWKV